MEVQATTINKVCLSGLASIYLADLMIRAGEADIVVAGGMESMTQAPHILPGARAGFRYGGQQLQDAITIDGLTCALDALSMGEATDRFAAQELITRTEQDELAVASHERATLATREGRLGEEIVHLTITARRGDPVVVSTDEGVRLDASLEAMSKLRPAFWSEGTVTAGNASQLSDGAAAVVVASPAAVERLGITPLAEIVGHGQVAGPGTSLLHQPSGAIADALERSGIALADVGLFEINEAFAAVAVASCNDLSLPRDVVNVNGGAIALGHPIGMSGTRLALTLSYELRRRGGGTGAAALCGGGGQGDALLLRTLR
jgi:acetyl-CoA C-acetyltransferase